MSDYYIGVMSGTSCDGIDAILVDLEDTTPVAIAHHTKPFASEVRNQLLDLANNHPNSRQMAYEYDIKLGKLYAQAVIELLEKTTVSARKIKAIGCHGQTICHQPDHEYPHTIQIGDPNTVALLTNITTVSDFRRKDLANFGQGAPLTPVFHHNVFAKASLNRAIVNIGGISNITFLDAGEAPVGFDTGPGNVLLDLNAQRYLKQPYDKDGAWAASGQVVPALLTEMLSDPYFSKAPPKSTGKEKFNKEWLMMQTAKPNLPKYQPEDLQATLVELTAKTIARAASQHNKSLEACYICGGGAFNAFLMKRLSVNLACPVKTTESLGVPPQWVEASAFAWLAQQTMNKVPLDLRKITGAAKPAILGGVYFP